MFQLICVFRLKAQSSDYIPLYFDQYIRETAIVNPANTDTSYYAKLSLGNKSELGMFQGISKLFADVDIRLNSKETKNTQSHFIGIQVVNSREGEYINRSRMYLRYGWRTTLTAKSSISAASGFGFVNYSFRTSQAGVGGSAFVPDLNAGVWYLHKRTRFGVALQQALQEEISPINQRFRLERYYNFNFIHAVPIGDNYNIESHTFFLYQPFDQYTQFSQSLIMSVYDKYEFGSNYRHQRGIVFLAGIKSMELNNTNLSLHVSYLFANNTIVRVGDTALEVLLGISL